MWSLIEIICEIFALRVFVSNWFMKYVGILERLGVGGHRNVAFHWQPRWHCSSVRGVLSWHRHAGQGTWKTFMLVVYRV
jgi:hypothetical protein